MVAFSVSISARKKSDQESARLFLQKNFKQYSLKAIDSIFGFAEYCRLYGGRLFTAPELSERDIKWMNNNGIGYRIPLTNLIVKEEDYASAQPFLEKHHRDGNSVICVRDELAKWVRRDFPKYAIEASVIKALDSQAKIEVALEIYDTVVPNPTALNDKLDALNAMPQSVKDKLRLFLNVGCMYTCPQRICYGLTSKFNRREPVELHCSRETVDREYKGSLYEFSMKSYLEIGIHRFKVLRSNGFTGN